MHQEKRDASVSGYQNSQQCHVDAGQYYHTQEHENGMAYGIGQILASPRIEEQAGYPQSAAPPQQLEQAQGEQQGGGEKILHKRMTFPKEGWQDSCLQAVCIQNRGGSF